ncbi:hypothetical protein Hamer_G002137 [Homarus americanus]|uniref:Uncharacterized protein n=1 Tax=Homarus americanus TaxID=6706 RepID=A0A8J5MSY9_HOMAM|nr:hypothetical protein Hamer_G002137 [Homarus americanus]
MMYCRVFLFVFLKDWVNWRLSYHHTHGFTIRHLASPLLVQSPFLSVLLITLLLMSVCRSTMVSLKM